MADSPWLDPSEYPFAPRRFQTAEGSMSYLDVGDGPPVVFVHGNPSWSFEFRSVIRLLSPGFRCIAPDHLGFGLSDKPEDGGYTPEQQAARLAAFLDSLDLKGVTLVTGDWGGPLGLSWALDHGDRVKNLVITNSWMWSVADDWYYRAFSGFVGGPLGRWLIRRRNFFVRDLLPMLWGDRTKFSPAVRSHYLRPLTRTQDRRGNQTFPRHIIASSSWLEGLWKRRDALERCRKTILWGCKDIAFRDKELKRWTEAYPDAKVIRLDGVGHLVAEEAPEVLAAEIRSLAVTG